MKELSPELESALVAYLEGDCTPHEADLLKAWLAADPTRKIGDGTPDEVRNNQEVIDAYLGVAHD